MQRIIMRQFMSLLLAAAFVFGFIPLTPRAAVGIVDESFAVAAARLIQENMPETPFPEIALTIGEDVMTVAGEEVPVVAPEAFGSDVLLPVLDIAAAIDAEVSTDGEQGRISVTVDDNHLVVEEKPDPAGQTVISPEDGLIRTEYPDGRVAVSVPQTAGSALAQEFGLEVHIDGDNVSISKPFQLGQVILRLAEEASLNESHGASQTITDGNGLYLLQYDSAEQAKAAHDAYQQEPDAEFVAPNTLFSSYKFGYGTGRIGAPEMQKKLLSVPGSDRSLTVAVVDSGLTPAHSSFSGRVLPGYNFAYGSTDTSDDHSHGTHVAGTIVDCTPGNVKIMPVKVISDAGYGTELQLYLGIRYAVDNGAEVINMSLGMKNCPGDCLIEEAVEYATQKGVTCVAAAGNDNIDTANVCPAGIPEVITVSAVDSYDVFCSFSNYGSTVDVAAPGQSIYSTLPDGSLRTLSGTSMAAPHAAAAAAMLILYDSGLDTPEKVEAALRASTIDVGEKGWDSCYGAGVIDFRVLLGGDGLKDDTGIEISDSSISVERISDQEMEYAFTITVLPKSARNKSVVVTSSDPSVVEYRNGALWAKKKGTATITATTVSGHQAQCKVSVDAYNDGLWIDVAATSFAGGTGSKEDPYLISTPEQLAKLARDVNIENIQYYDTYFKLTQDINLSGRKWKPIAKIHISTKTSILYGPFLGHFDGDYHTIRNMLIRDVRNLGSVGFFGGITYGSVRNLAITNADVRSEGQYSRVGILAGALSKGTISNCYTTGISTRNGFVSYVTDSQIDNSFAIADAGEAGFVGELGNSQVFNCYSAGTVNTSVCPKPAGFMYRSSQVANSLDTKVINCFSTIDVIGGEPFGFAAFTGGGIYRNNYYSDRNVKGAGESSGYKPAKVEPQKWAFFTARDTFANGSGYWDDASPWDFTSVWTMDSYVIGGLPYLKGFSSPPTYPSVTTGVDGNYLIPAEEAPSEGFYIDLDSEQLIVPAGYNIAAYSTDGGRKWKVGEPNLTKLLNKATELCLLSEYDRKNKKDLDLTDMVHFPRIEARPKKTTLLINYAICADLTGQTTGAWTLAPKGSDEAAIGIHLAATEDKKTPKVQEDGTVWFPIGAGGIPVLPYGAERETYLVRKKPVVTGDALIPASKIFKVSPKTAAKPTKVRANYKKESIKPKVGSIIFGGDLNALAVAGSAAVLAESAESFAPGLFYQLTASDKNGISLTAVLDATDEATNLTQSLCIWTPATEKKPASQMQEYKLAIRASLETQTLAGENGRVTIPNTLEFYSDGRWGRLPRYAKTITLENAVRLKSKARGDGEDDSALLAASKPASVHIEYGVFSPANAKRERSGILSIQIGGIEQQTPEPAAQN